MPALNTLVAFELFKSEPEESRDKVLEVLQRFGFKPDVPADPERRPPGWTLFLPQDTLLGYRPEDDRSIADLRDRLLDELRPFVAYLLVAKVSTWALTAYDDY